MDRNMKHLESQIGHLLVADAVPDDLSKIRKWQHSSQSRGIQGASMLFTIASYNILSQTLLEEHNDMYLHLDDHFLEWNHRKQQLMKELKHYHPDIICLQEVDAQQYEELFKPQLAAMGYEGSYKKRTNDKVDGCATFYKREKFVCEKSVWVEYCHPEIGLLDRDNIGLLLLLRPRNVHLSSEKLCIANTHLLYNPRRGDIKLAQLMLLLAKIDEVAQKADRETYYPVILCGDLNLEPNSELYLFLCRGVLQYNGLLQHKMSGQNGEVQRFFEMKQDFLGTQRLVTDQCQYLNVLRQRRSLHEISFGSGYVTHRLNLVSVYPHFKLFQNRRVKECTSASNGETMNVDYILYSVQGKKSCFRNGMLQTSVVTEGSLSPVRMLELLPVPQIEALGGLPTRRTSSDHLILLAEFCLHS